MAVPANLVVGVIGLLLFAGTSAIIVRNFDDLAGTKPYQATVRTVPQNHGVASNSIGSGATRSESFTVDAANVTRALVGVSWTESGLPIARHEVTVTLRDPKNNVVAQEKGIGAAGVTIDRTLLAGPTGERFTATPDGAPAAFLKRYPAHPEGRGRWAVTVATDTPTQPGAGSLTYTITFQTEHYVVSYAPLVVVK